jgi:hypothetical protein
MSFRSWNFVLELYNLLVRPESEFQLRWHRDDIPPDIEAEEEERRLVGEGERKGYRHAQWNLALYDDESLLVVPGSHRRARTEAERNAGPHDELEGMMAVKLGPGDGVFYDNNILHRGVYDCGKERMTLHGSMGMTGCGADRARNVLQHGIGSWIERCDFSNLDLRLKQRAEVMRANLLDMGILQTTGFSQID